MQAGAAKVSCSALVLGRGVVVGKLGAFKAQNKLFRACKVVFQHSRQLSRAASPQNANKRPCRPPTAIRVLDSYYKIVIFALELRKRTFLYLACTTSRGSAFFALGLCYKIVIFALDLEPLS